MWVLDVRFPVRHIGDTAVAKLWGMLPSERVCYVTALIPLFVVSIQTHVLPPAGDVIPENEVLKETPTVGKDRRASAVALREGVPLGGGFIPLDQPQPRGYAGHVPAVGSPENSDAFGRTLSRRDNSQIHRSGEITVKRGRSASGERKVNVERQEFKHRAGDSFPQERVVPLPSIISKCNNSYALIPLAALRSEPSGFLCTGLCERRPFTSK